MIIATPVQDDPGVRLFIGWQGAVDLIFEALRSDSLAPGAPFVADAAHRLNEGQFLKSI